MINIMTKKKKYIYFTSFWLIPIRQIDEFKTFSELKYDFRNSHSFVWFLRRFLRQCYVVLNLNNKQNWK